MIRILFLLLFCCGLLSSCSEKKDSNLYIGSYRIFDRQIPHPYFFQKTDEQLFYYNNEGERIATIELDSALASGDSISLPNQHFYFSTVNDSIINFYDLNDSLKYFYKGRLMFKKFAKFRKVESHPLNLKEVDEQLKTGLWVTPLDSTAYATPNNDLDIIQSWRFTNDSLHQKLVYSYDNQNMLNETKSLKYKLFTLERNVFLSLLGGTENPLPIYQIISSSANKLELIDFHSRYPKTISLVNSKEPQDANYNNTDNYSTCFYGFQGEYYHERITYIHGNDSIKNKVNSGFPEKENTAGYVIVHFNINCKKQVGDIGLLQMNFEYKPTRFNANTIEHLIKNVKELKDSPSPVSTNKYYAYQDVHAFLMFKIKDGIVKDVSP